MVRATWTTHRASGNKFQNVKKFYTKPEITTAFDIVVQLQREGIVRSFHTNIPLYLGRDMNDREVWCIPDCELTTNNHPPRLVVIRVQGRAWHEEGDEDDAEQKRRLENLHYLVIDIFVDEQTDWNEVEEKIRSALKV